MHGFVPLLARDGALCSLRGVIFVFVDNIASLEEMQALLDLFGRLANVHVAGRVALISIVVVAQFADQIGEVLTDLVQIPRRQRLKVLILASHFLGRHFLACISVLLLLL